MAIALTLVDTFTHGMNSSEPRQRVAFNSTGTYCAVGVMNNFAAGAGISGNAEVWIYKLAAGHWTKVGTLVTDGFWDYDEAWQVAIADNGTVVSVGNNTPIIHRWLSTGTDTWAADSYFYGDNSSGSLDSSYSGLALSSDGNVLAIWDDYNGSAWFRIWTGMSGTKVLRQSIDTTSIDRMGAVVSSDGKRILIGQSYGTGSPCVRVYTSTTLGSNSWTIASTVTLPDVYGYGQGMKMTADMAYVVFGTDGSYSSTPAHEMLLHVLHNTTSTTYVYLGAWQTVDVNYNAILSFGLSNAGKLLISGFQSSTTLAECWSVDDVSVTPAGVNTLVDAVAQPTGLTSLPWCCSLDLDPTGAWACFQGSGHSSTSGYDNVSFCSVATFVPVSEFWKDFVKSTETL